MKGSEASDVMTDTSADGRWLLYALTSSTDLVILEKQRQAPEHLANSPFWNKASCTNKQITKRACLF